MINTTKQPTVTAHNPAYKLVSTVIDLGNKIGEFVYGETNEGENKGLELYYYRKGSNQHYYSKRWLTADVPAWVIEIHNSLQNKVKDCDSGCKLSLRDLSDFM